MFDQSWWIFEISYSILWVGGFMILSFRCQQNERVYFGRFPPTGPYQMLERHNPFWNPQGALRNLHRLRDTTLRHQDDPELEQLRREVWRSNVLTFLWFLGVPILTFGTIALLNLAGHPLAL